MEEELIRNQEQLRPQEKKNEVCINFNIVYRACTLRIVLLWRTSSGKVSYEPLRFHIGLAWMSNIQ